MRSPVRPRLWHARDLFNLLLVRTTPSAARTVAWLARVALVGAVSLLTFAAVALSPATKLAFAQTAGAGDLDAGAGTGHARRWPPKRPWPRRPGVDGGAPAAIADAGARFDAASNWEESDASAYAAPLQSPPTTPGVTVDDDGGTNASAIDAGPQVISNAAAAAASGPVIRIPATDAE